MTSVDADIVDGASRRACELVIGDTRGADDGRIVGDCRAVVEEGIQDARAPIAGGGLAWYPETAVSSGLVVDSGAVGERFGPGAGGGLTEGDDVEGDARKACSATGAEGCRSVVASGLVTGEDAKG